MSKIFLANAPYTLKERYGGLSSIGSTLPHLGLLMLGAVLRQHGHRVRIVDASALGLDYRKTVEDIKAFRPDIIALTAVTPSIGRAERLASMIKRYAPAIPIVIGGPHVTALPEKTLQKNQSFDFGVIGEGEQTVIELMEKVSRKEHPSEVPGVVFRENGVVKCAPPRQLIKDLDALPFPAWDLLDGFPSHYHPALFKYRRLPSTHVISARGCPNQCIFCDTSVFGSRVRFHSAHYILDMIGYLIRRFHIREIIFEDDQFLLKTSRVKEFCEGLLRQQNRISWSCSGRVDSVKDIELLRLMKRAGCWQINYGIESGDQEILDFAKKRITLEQIERAVRLTREAGIFSKAFFIFGLPYESEETMKRTIEFALRLPLDDISVFMLTPFPGSELHDTSARYGTLENDFEKMNILNVVFVPHGLKRERLAMYQKLFMKRFYLRPRIVGNYLARIIQNPSNIKSMVKALSGFMASVHAK
jgi:radical SAM superfamily enzyme YgiQ (UPF0313 family)